MLLTTRHKTKLRNALESNMSTNIKLSQTQIAKIGFLGSFLSKLAGPLIKVVVPLVKNILAPLGLTGAASAIDARIEKKIHGSGMLFILNEELNNILKIVEALEDSNILLKGITKAIENETKKQKDRFLGILIGTLGVSLLGNMLTGKGIARAGYGNNKF